MSASRYGMSVDEFSGLVAVVLTDRLDPDILNSYVPDSVETNSKRVRRSSAPCPQRSSSVSSPPRSFLPPIPRSTSLFESLAFLGLKLPSTTHQRTPSTSVHGHTAHIERQNSIASTFRRRRPRTASTTPTPTPSPDMSATLDSRPYTSTLVMGSGTPSNGRKPLALLSKFKKQLSKSSPSSSPTITSSPSSSPGVRGQPHSPEFIKTNAQRNTGFTTPPFDRTAAPTVSFAPTPVPSPSASTFTAPTARSSTSSSSGVLSRSSTSDAGSSFLDCEDKKSFRASSSKLRNSLFRNPNSHLISRSQQDSSSDSSNIFHGAYRDHEDDFTDESDIQSVATADTIEEEEEESGTTESGDYIPYIPLVLRREQEYTRLRTDSQVSCSPPGPMGASSRRRMARARALPARNTPSPTPSCSTIGSASTRSPRTPKTPVFGHHQESNLSVSAGSDEEQGSEGQDMLSFTSSSLDSSEEAAHAKVAFPSSANEIRINAQDPFMTGFFDSRKARHHHRPQHTVSTTHASQGHNNDEDDDVFRPTHPFAAAVSNKSHLDDDGEDGENRDLDTTSESCYSTESYHDRRAVADESMYRRSRMDSAVLPLEDDTFRPGGSGGRIAQLRGSTSSAPVPGKSTPFTIAHYNDIQAHHMSAPPDIRIETAAPPSGSTSSKGSSDSDAPTSQTSATQGHGHGLGHPSSHTVVGHALDHLLRVHDAQDEESEDGCVGFGRSASSGSPSRCYQPPLAPSLEVGRQTIDPRTLRPQKESVGSGSAVGGGARERGLSVGAVGSRTRKSSSRSVKDVLRRAVGGGSGEASSAGEWTLGLGNKESEEFGRMRSKTLSQSGRKREVRDGKEKEKARGEMSLEDNRERTRSRTKSAASRMGDGGKVRERKDSEKKKGKKAKAEAIPPVPALRLNGGDDVVGGGTIPFANDLHVQRPLLRMQSLLDLGGESSADDGPIPDEDEDDKRALRRSGSANPILDASSRQARKSAEQTPDQVDWTLMLPLPFPGKTKSNLLGASAKGAAEKKPFKVVHKARSSVDMKSAPMAHVRTRRPSFGGKKGMAHEVKPEASPMQHKKELSAEEMMAVILGHSDAPSSGGANNADEVEVNMGRDDHRQKAMDMLLGSPTSPTARAHGSLASALLIPPMPVPKPPSPATSCFEQRLSDLVTGRTDDDGGNEHELREAKALSSLPTPPPTSRYNTLNPMIKTRPPSVYHSNPTLPPSLPPSASATFATKIGRAPNSLASRAHIGISGQKPTLGLSFSQYNATNSPTLNALNPLQSPISPQHTRASSGMLPFVVARSSSPAVNTQRPRTAPQAGAAAPIKAAPRGAFGLVGRLGGKVAALTKRGQMTPIIIPAREPPSSDAHGRGSVLGEASASSPTHSLAPSVLSVASTASASSTDTVVPVSGKANDETLDTPVQSSSSSGGDSVGVPVIISTDTSAIQGSDPRATILLEDFPLPPSSHHLTASTEKQALRSLPSLSLLKTASGPAVSGDKMPLTPVLGAEEDVELPPPTPIVKKRISPLMDFTGARRSPAGSARASPVPSGSVLMSPPGSALGHASSSQWMDDDDEEEEDYGTPMRSSGDGGFETDYEDAVSVLAMSDEDYEDAVSMLSGVFYSARTSFDTQA